MEEDNKFTLDDKFTLVETDILRTLIHTINKEVSRHEKLHGDMATAAALEASVSLVAYIITGSVREEYLKEVTNGVKDRLGEFIDMYLRISKGEGDTWH